MIHKHMAKYAIASFSLQTNELISFVERRCRFAIAQYVVST
ncbi:MULTISPECIES: hypothetical protein [unclassified Tolypothrix]|nr:MULTISPECIES: hypothetical protein [unclassified Tolypothrix]